MPPCAKRQDVPPHESTTRRLRKRPIVAALTVWRAMNGTAEHGFPTSLPLTLSAPRHSGQLVTRVTHEDRVISPSTRRRNRDFAASEASGTSVARARRLQISLAPDSVLCDRVRLLVPDTLSDINFLTRALREDIKRRKRHVDSPIQSISTPEV